MVLPREDGRLADGKRRRKFFSDRGKKSDAQRRIRALLTASDQGMPVEIRKQTVARLNKALSLPGP